MCSVKYAVNNSLLHHFFTTLSLLGKDVYNLTVFSYCEVRILALLSNCVYDYLLMCPFFK